MATTFHSIKLLLLLPVLAACLPARGADSKDNWPHWRGPLDAGSAEGGSYPVKWDGTANLRWKTALPGKGCSTPIVWEQRIYLTAPVNKKDAVLAYDWAGKPLWQTPFGVEKAGKHQNGSGCNPSVITDGTGLYVYFKSGTLAALELDGKVRWQTNLIEKYGGDTLYWDYGSTPAVTEKFVIFSMARHGNSYLAAFDKISGNMVYKVARDYQTPIEGDHSYASPLVIQQQGKEALLVWAGQVLTAHDTADGKLLWSCGNFNPGAKLNWVAVASPLIIGDMAIVPFGRGNRIDGIKLGGSGDVTATHRVWMREDSGAFVPTPAAYQGKVYLLRDRGQIERIDPATGKTEWGGELPKSGSNYYASPTVADGKLYAAREDGVIYVVRLTGEFAVLSENTMAERIIASPVPSANRLLIRGEKNLFCIGE